MLSVYETGLPHCLDPYTMNTLGEDDLGGHVKMRSFGAHFRVDMAKKVHYNGLHAVDIVVTVCRH